MRGGLPRVDLVQRVIRIAAAPGAAAVPAAACRGSGTVSAAAVAAACSRRGRSVVEPCGGGGGAAVAIEARLVLGRSARAAASHCGPAARHARARRSRATSAVTGAPLSSCSISSRQRRDGAAQRLHIGGVRESVLSSMRFSRFSIAQANSPSSRAPTMRPLPFSVWNQRRTVTSASRSSGFWSHSGKPCWILTISSWASSMKSFTSSGSASRPVRGSRGAGDTASVGRRVLDAPACPQRDASAAPRRLGICTVCATRPAPAAARWARDGRLLLLERLHAGLRVVEHVPGIGCARPAASPCSTRR